MPAFAIAPALVSRDARRVYRIPGLPGFELDLAPMTKANKPYWSDVLAKASTLAAAGASEEAFDDGAQARGRRRDAELMAKHVLVGWRGVVNDAGQPVPFSSTAALDFLVEIATTEGAEHIFDGIRGFARNDDNFTNGAIAAAKALAGNSVGG